MMRRSVGTRVVRTFLYTVFLHFILTVAGHAKDPSPSSILRRQKRTWQWNMLVAYEEKPPQNPPEMIGRVKNTLSNLKTEFRLLGDGAGDTFTLNKAGEVLVLKKLDREKISNYTLRAQLIDTKTGRKVEEDTEFTVKVQDINDHTPVFSEPYTGTVQEQAAKGTLVMKVQATDKDDPTSINGMVVYKLLNGTNLFSINNRTGEISTKVDTLDHEIQSEYHLMVQASDMPGIEGGRSASTVVTISIEDIDDNEATFSKQSYHFTVKEDVPVEFKIGILGINDRDEEQNKNPVFDVEDAYKNIFGVKVTETRDGVLKLNQNLDYEMKQKYTFTIKLIPQVQITPDYTDLWTSAKIHITVEDVDEPPVFTQEKYIFNVLEGEKNVIVGSISAKDPDRSGNRIWYSIQDPECPVNINKETGQLTLKFALDREDRKVHEFLVRAEENSMSRISSNTTVRINVQDINDNVPELTKDSNVYICENDQIGTVLGVIHAIDKDENSENFRFKLIGKSSNFSLQDNRNNTATIILIHGSFSTEHSVVNILEIEITDGGKPPRKSITSLPLKVCKCGQERHPGHCMAPIRSGVSVSALIAILLCILTILVIVILFVLRKRYQKQELALGKTSGDIHEQLVAYDEEGGGEMDTNTYDVSILSSARSDTRLGPDPLLPPMYAVAKKPSACKGDMAVMIEVKKDEADQDRDVIPYDTLHIYGYEGSESLAGSLSSLESSSSNGSDLDYNFLNDWGPRFRTLAQIYGSDVNAEY